MEESLEARPGRSAEAIDRLVVVADDEWITAGRHQLDQALLGEVQVLVLVDKHIRESARVALEHRGALFQHPHGEQQQVVEIEQPLLAALLLVSAKQPHAGAHELCALGLVARGGPSLDAIERHQLLLHAFEHLQDR